MFTDPRRLLRTPPFLPEDEAAMAGGAPPPIPSRPPMAMPPPRPAPEPQMTEVPRSYQPPPSMPSAVMPPPPPPSQWGADVPPPMPAPPQQTAMDRLRGMKPPEMPKSPIWKQIVGNYAGAFLGPNVGARIAYGGQYVDDMNKFGQERRFLTEQAGFEHQAKQDELAAMQKQAYAANMESIARDREADNARQESQRIAGLGTPVQEGEIIDPQRWSYTEDNGKKYKKATEFGAAEQKKEAEQVNWRPVPDLIAKKLGMTPGTKVPPNELDSYARLVETAEQREQDRAQRAELQKERLGVQQALASVAQANRGSQNDFKNTMQMRQQYKTENVVKMLPDVRNAYQGMTEAAQRGDSVGDITLMRLFAKLTDPTTGVREEEYRTFINAQGIKQKWELFKSGKWVEGEKLPPEMRQQFLKMAEKIYRNRQRDVANIQNVYRKNATRFSVDPELLFEEEADGGATPADAQNNQPKPIVQRSKKTGKYRYTTDGGKTWHDGQPK